MKRVFTWDIPLSVTAASVLSYSATFMFVMRLSAFSIIISVLIWCFVFSAIAAYRKALLRGLPFLLILVPAVWFFQIYRPFIGMIEGYMKWMWAVNSNPGYERLTAGLITFAVTAPVFILFRCRSPAVILLLAGGALFFGLENAGYEYPGVLFWIFLLTVLMQMAHTAAGRGPQLPSVFGFRLLTALPACLLAVFIAGMAVGPETDPLDFFRHATGSFGIFPAKISNRPAADITGLGRDMGGPFNPSGQLMLTVRDELNSFSQEGPYLRGGVGIFYDGRRWYGGDFEGLDILPGDLAPPHSAGPVRTYSIVYENLRGTRLYLPYGTAEVRFPEPYRLVWHTGDIFRLASDSGKGLFYTARAYSSEFLPMQRPGHPNIPEESPGDYMQLPQEFPLRIRNLVSSLAVYGSDYYDALAIERYLIENYPYNPNMPATPDGRDFVDYFLFEQREGYCTYFATAMTVMCRAAGLPARYVDGFAPSDEKTGGEFQYTDEYAHAWVEVWIEDIGWMQFEPTPGYNRADGPISFPDPVIEASPPPEVPMPSLSPSPEIPTPSPDRPDRPDGRTREDGSRPFPWGWILCISLPLLGIFLTWLALRIRRKRFEKMLLVLPYGQKEVKRIYEHLLWLVSHARVKPLPHETLGELADRADEVWPTKIYVMRRVADIYGKSCYADERLTEEDSETLRHYVDILELREQIHLGAKRYWLYSKVLNLLPERKKDERPNTFEF